MNNETISIIYRQLSVNRNRPERCADNASTPTATAAAAPQKVRWAQKSDMVSRVWGNLQSAICHRAQSACNKQQVTCNWAASPNRDWHRFRCVRQQHKSWERDSTLLDCTIHSFVHSFTHALTRSCTHSRIHSFIIDRSVLRAIVCNRICRSNNSKLSRPVSVTLLAGYMIRLFIVLWLGY